MKKILIWVGCFLGAILINVLLYPFGVSLGFVALPAIIIWLPLHLCKKVDLKTVEEEAHSKGVSIRQYVASAVPSSLMEFCEENKGNSSTIKKKIKQVEELYIEEGEPIPKRILFTLFEMYK